MTDELDRRLTERVEAATPDPPPPYVDVLALRAHRRTRRRVAGVTAAIVAVGAVATVVAVVADRPSGGDHDVDLATDGPSPTGAAPSLVVPTAGTGGAPPPIVVAGAGSQLDTWQGSYCWVNACADMISPPLEALPDVRAAATVRAGFAEPATWTATLSGREPCATYAVLLTPSGDGTYVLIPSGPAADYRSDVFLYPASGGDTSGLFRWTTSGASAPRAWAHLHQDGPHEGGGGIVQVVLDGAAVDGRVTGEVSVSGAKGTSRTFDLAVSEQGCPGDRYVLLAPGGQVDRAIDGLGDGPFTYDVDVVVDGTHHRATSTSADGAEDTPLTFSPALPR